MTSAVSLTKILAPIVWVAAFLSISYFIGQVTRENMGWYADLIKSPYTPPDLAFPIAWSLLYTLLAIAGSQLWARKTAPNGRNIFILFGVYMLVNWAWSFIFFAAHAITLGFIWILISDLLLFFLIALLWRHKDKVTALLVTPTLLWSIFAAYLNGYIVFS